MRVCGAPEGRRVGVEVAREGEGEGVLDWGLRPDHVYVGLDSDMRASSRKVVLIAPHARLTHGTSDIYVCAGYPYVTRIVTRVLDY